MIKIKIYTKDDCIKCKTHGERVKKLFQNSKICTKYQVYIKHYNHDPYEDLAELIYDGILGFPTLKINNLIYIGDLPTNREIIKILRELNNTDK